MHIKNQIKSVLKFLINLIHYLIIRIGFSNAYIGYLRSNISLKYRRSLYTNFKVIAKKNIDYLAQQNVFIVQFFSFFLSKDTKLLIKKNSLIMKTYLEFFKLTASQH